VAETAINIHIFSLLDIVPAQLFCLFHMPVIISEINDITDHAIVFVCVETVSLTTYIKNLNFHHYILYT
jgi:hypothetical protein